MTKRDTMKANFAKVNARLGKTTGVSKGSKPPPSPKVKVRPTGGLKPTGIRGTVTFKW